MMNTMNESYIHLTSLFMHTLNNFYAKKQEVRGNGTATGHRA